MALTLVTGCGTGEANGSPTPEMTETYDCGYGFYASNPEQTVGLFVELTDREAASISDIPGTSQLDDGTWYGRLVFGTDLFANWCDDVLEPDEPTPEVGETWLLSGKIRIDELPPSGHGMASATLSDLEAHGPNNELIVFDDFAVENQFWGTFPG